MGQLVPKFFQDWQTELPNLTCERRGYANQDRQYELGDPHGNACTRARSGGKVRDGEDVIASTRDACAPQNSRGDKASSTHLSPYSLHHDITFDGHSRRPRVRALHGESSTRPALTLRAIGRLRTGTSLSNAIRDSRIATFV